MADPALVFEDPADRPGTHVLLIGIGDYPWLEEGSSFVPAQHAENAMGMAQLGSPPISIRQLADWFLDGFANPGRPLSSLAMLLSEEAPATYTHPKLAAAAGPLPRGAIGEVSAATAAWIARASARRDNLVVFAFCGHGVQSGNPVLLCRDYGSNTENAFEGAIDFEQFRIALSTRQPDQQLVLIDACRTPAAEDALLGQATPGNPLLAVKSLTTRENTPAVQSVQFATSLFTEAWGRSDGPSLFSEALITALGGGAAEHSADWWVTTSRLHSVLSTYLQRTSREEGVVQRPAAQTQDFPLCKPERIKVPLYVRSSEPAIWGHPVQLEARRGDVCAKRVVYEPPPDPAARAAFRECELELENPSQEPQDVVYDVHALFEPQAGWSDCAKRVIAYPPEVTCELPVKAR